MVRKQLNCFLLMKPCWEFEEKGVVWVLFVVVEYASLRASECNDEDMFLLFLLDQS